MRVNLPDTVYVWRKAPLSKSFRISVPDALIFCVGVVWFSILFIQVLIGHRSWTIPIGSLLIYLVVGSGYAWVKERKRKAALEGTNDAAGRED